MYQQAAFVPCDPWAHFLLDVCATGCQQRDTGSKPMPLITYKCKKPMNTKTHKGQK